MKAKDPAKSGTPHRDRRFPECSVARTRPIAGYIAVTAVISLVCAYFLARNQSEQLATHYPSGATPEPSTF